MADLISAEEFARLVERGDAVEIGLGQVNRRQRAVGDGLAGLGDGQQGRIHRAPQPFGCTKMCAGSAARSRG